MHRRQSNEEFLASKRRAGSKTVADKSASEYELTGPGKIRTKEKGAYLEDSDDEYGIPAYQRRQAD